MAWIALPAIASSPSGAQPEPDRTGCSRTDRPFGEVAGADLTPTIHTSKDATPVRYVRWRGFVPSFDGLPLSVDVTVPCDGRAEPRPTIVMAHGFTDDKTIWEETDKSDTVDSKDRPGPNSHWNDIWFASRGYTVLTYTARGWHDSCGPDTPGMGGGQVAPRCAGHEYWIHLDDKRWEVRDAQWLTGGLVQSGAADAGRLVITGGSYGGGPASMAALLGDRQMCGADPVPAELGPDPCQGKSDGDLVPWTTPDGEDRLQWAAAVPMYTFADLLQVLAPNGRWTAGWDDPPFGPGGPVKGSSTDPVGVPIESTLRGLLLAAQAFGSLAPPGTDPSSDIAASADRLLAGPPYPADDPAVAQGIHEYETYKSPVTIEPTGRVPIFWVHGLTDALFPASEAITMYDHLRGVDPDYPIKLFLGDLGHDYASERVDEWRAAKVQMNAFVDHYLRPDRTPKPPTFDVSAAITRCLDHDAPMRIERAHTWDGLQSDPVTFVGRRVQKTSTTTPGPAGTATDPISTATLGGPDSYKGCRIMTPSEPDPTVATYEFAMDRELVLLGAPVVDLEVEASGPDVPVAVRVWDVAPDRSRQGLVTRGVYRMGAAGRDRLRFQLAPQGYRFPKGHHVKVEITANDAPYLLANTAPADLTVKRLSIALPHHTEEGGPRASDLVGSRAVAPHWFGVAGVVIVSIGFVALLGGLIAWLVGRRAAAARR